ncbi:RNA methyltransferase, TrmH family [Sporobacter termitidis DSM 10068]|uniref:RNA methyltransferase, TrmH family n=1 Tax=Sporobacter termitidis DSM 10068 TaxID=1123282 RepID=A0A1M5ULN9_9FIRM|nr:RNA methyltransferase [Sporobacter termitidis]SHH63786.1 RNA methyltransferase, TrmH family [Sporobacter termitidis DSM 10068]
MTEIKSRKNPLIVHLKKLGADGDYRHERGEFLCDGEKLLREAVQNGAEVRAVLTSAGTPPWLPDGVPVYAAGQDILASVSPLKNPQSVLFSCAAPAPGGEPAAEGAVLVLENIQDPGNVGTVLRTANALGIGTVVLTGSCADPYNPKTIRATMGAIFRQRILTLSFDGVAALRTARRRLYGAALAPDSRNIRDVALHNAAVVIGSEGRGLSREMLGLCDEKIIIPMSPGSESLNAAAAAAIVLWEMARQ